MQTVSIAHLPKDTSIPGMTAKYCFLLIFSCLVSAILAGTVWSDYEHILHTHFELTSVFITLSLFIIVFLTHEVNTNSSRMIGYGFLAVAIYNILHINYLFTEDKLHAYFDISDVYWQLSRLTEVFILFFSMLRIKKAGYKRWVSLVITLSVVSVTVFSVSCFYSELALTILKNMSYSVIAKEYFTYFIISMYIAALYFAYTKYKINKKLKYKYIFIAIIFIIQTEISFSIKMPFFDSLGHILKLICYYHLYMGIFSGAVINPYESLEKTRKMLQDSHYDLQKILNGLPVAIMTFDSKGRVRFANSNAERLLECKAEDVLYVSMGTLDEMFKPEESIKSKFEGYDFGNSKGMYNEVMQLMTLKNNKVSLDVTVFKYKNGILASFTDVKKEQELADLKIQTKTILNAISNSVAILDKNRKILNCNKAFLEFMEIDRESEIASMNFDEFILTLNFAVLIPSINNSGDRTKLGQNQECSLITASGSRKEFIIREAPVVNVDNEIIGYAIVLTDVTELKKEQRKVMNQEKLALIGQMGSGIVHETKNYLASIKGYCQLLSMKITDEQMAKYVKKIDNITDDVNTVVVDFLSLAKPTENDIMDVVSLNETIESMRYMLESPSFMKGVKMVLNLSESESDIIANEAQIKQVILNMAKNAIEAMSNVKDARLEVSTKLSESGKEMLLIISDNGRGIPKESLPLLGTPFYTTKETGTGLGLNVCYKIIKEHGGRVHVESEEGAGTAFTIYLPIFLK